MESGIEFGRCPPSSLQSLRDNPLRFRPLGFRALLAAVFRPQLRAHLPQQVLPKGVSSQAPSAPSGNWLEKDGSIR